MSGKQLDFLKTRGARAIKSEIQSIVDSYHHYWDPLAELLQNSRDAIQRSKAADPSRRYFIRILVDANSRRVEVLDNGVGIPEDMITELLGPGGGDKSELGDEVGEKGVGLTYSIFSADEFSVESRHEGRHHGGRVLKARSWRESSGAVTEPPQFEVTKEDDLTESSTTILLGSHSYDLSSFTKISLSGLAVPKEDYDPFTFSADQIRCLLTTRTAVGVTDRLHDDSWTPPFDLYINVVHPSGGTGGLSPLEPGYEPPHQFVEDDDDVISLQDAVLQLTRKKDEAKKHKLLAGKTIWESREVDVGGKKVRVYGVMFPGNKVFDQLAEARGLSATSDSQDPLLLESGIFVATKGMPTGVSIPEGSGGQYPAYYKRCLFVVESDSVKFDMGRKSMHHAYRRRLQTGVSEVFKDLEALAPYQSTDRVRSKPLGKNKTKAERERETRALWNRYEGLVDLKVPAIAFGKVPGKQEAAVAAIFHELLGSGDIKGYKPLATGYGTRYDLHALYEHDDGSTDRLVVEFKHTLDALIKDLQNGRKNFDDIHLLVAWDADEQKLKNHGFDLEIESRPRYDGVTHELDLPHALGVDPIPVVLLREFVKTLAV